MPTQTENKILIVDNDVSVNNFLLNKLKRTGYQCAKAANADQALGKLENNEFNLVVLDIALIGISVFELLSKIKAKYPNTAIIVTSPLGWTNIGIQCTKLGAYEYIAKPLITTDFISTLGAVLGKRKLELLKNDYIKHLQGTLAEKDYELRSSFINAITSLAHALDAKDRYTKGHSQRVTTLSVAIAREMRLPRSSIEKISMAAQVHDIGKIGVSGSILNKPGRLTKKESQNMQQHPVIGEHILNPILLDDQETLLLVRSHHERCDGSGYPDHLGKNRVLLGSRIIAVADVYDAMTSARPYRDGISSEAAIAELDRGITQFDPDVVSAVHSLVI
ncbi:MAG: response regulator [Dehalococcoidales bacterium]|nr:response regulator [Dehalococcoidales bacterium]